MEDKVQDALQRKIEQYDIIEYWFKHDLKNCKNKELIKGYKKNEIEVKAQIDILRFLLT